MEFLPIFFTAKKTQTQAHICDDISIPKFVFKKGEEIKLVSLPTPPPTQIPTLFISGRGQGGKQSRARAAERTTAFLVNIGLVQRGREETQV